jgi:hypothetical protein
MARPVNWPNQINAPEEALELYRLIAKLQRSEAFQHCHTFRGTVIGEVPHVSWEGKVTNLPKIVVSFLGLQYKKKQCLTHGCLNPFHYINWNENPTGGELKEIIEVPKPNLDSYKELINYYIEENDLTNPTFDQLRKLIPTEDAPDDLLQQAFLEMKEKNDLIQR